VPEYLHRHDHPPFGLEPVRRSGTLKRSVESVIAGIWPFIAVNIVVLVIISYVPSILDGPAEAAAVSAPASAAALGRGTAFRLPSKAARCCATTG